MADTLGKLQIELEARLAKFESDMGRAARLLQRDMVRAQQSAARAAENASRVQADASRRMADSISRDFDRLRSQAAQATRAVLGLFAVNFGAGMVRDLARVADGYANVQAKLRLVTADQSQLGRVSEQVFGIAQRTYSSLDATATLVSRTSRALVSNGATAEEALSRSLRLTETIQQAFAVSGATQAEASNAIIQLSQGLSAGALRGEEFNSVAEQGSRITQALAESLNVTIGELRAMAKEGKLTAEVIQTALTQQADKINAEFSQLPVTIERAFAQLGNAFTRYVGQVDAATGTSREIAEAIQGVAKNLPTIISLLTTAGTVAAAWFAVYRVGIPLINVTTAAVGRATSAIVAMNVAQQMGIASAGTWGTRLFAALGGWPAVVIAAGSAFYYLYDAMAEMEERSLAPLRAIEQINEKLREQAEAQRLAAEGVPADMQAAVSQYRQTQEAVENWQRALVEVESQLSQVIRNGGPGFNVLSEAAERLRGKIAATQDQLQQFAILSGQTSTDVIADFRRIAGEGGDALADLAQKAVGAAQLIGRVFSIGASSDAAAGQVEFTKEVQKTIDALRKQSETFGMAQSQLTLYEARLDAAKAATKEEAAAIMAAAQELSRKQAAQEAATLASQASARASREQAKAEREAAEAIRKVERAVRDSERATASYVRQQMELEDRYLDSTRALEEEIAVLSASGDAREELIIQLQAERMAREGNNGSLEEAIAHYKALLTQADMLRKQNAVVEEWENLWLDAANSVGDALTTALFDGADEGADAIKNVMEQLARDLIRFWLQQQIIIPLQQQLVGGMGGVAGMMGGGGGGGGFNLGGMMGGGGGGALGWASAGLGYGMGGYAIGSNIFGGSRENGRGGAIGGAVGGIVASTATGAAVIGAGLSAAGVGAALGSIVPIVGTIIGAILGAAIGELFETDPRIRISSRENDARFDTAFASGGVARDALPSGTATRFAEAITTFDNALAQMLGVFNSGAAQIQEIQGVLANWSLDVSNSAVSIENVLNQRFSAILGTFDQDIQQLVRGAGDLEAQVNALAAAFLASEAIDAGQDLGLTLESLFDVLMDFQGEAEGIDVTFQRIALSATLLDEAMGLMNISLDLGREQFVRFATDITEAAGGIEAAGQLWASYFSSFYTETERAALQLEQLNEAARQEFADIGQSFEAFTGSGGLQAFRTMFEQILPTLTAEQVAQWLQAAQALGIATQAQAAYNAILGQTINTIRDDGLSLSPPGQVGGEGALEPPWVGGSDGGREDGLVIVIPPIEFPPIDFGPIGGNETPLPDIDDEIDRRYQRELDWLRRLGDLQDSLMLDEQLSTLTPEQMLAEAQAQYEAALAGSMAGDENARADFDRAVRELLGQGRDFYSSSDAYTALFDRVQADIASLIAASPATTAAVTASASLNSAIATPASAADEVKALREDNEDQTVAIVERLTAVENENRQMKELLGQSVAELRRIRNGSPSR